MAKSVNKVILLGNVGKDPEIRSTAGGTMVAQFGLATTERTKDPQGNWTDKTEWHNIVTYGKLAEIIRDYVKKGSSSTSKAASRPVLDDKEHAVARSTAPRSSATTSLCSPAAKRAPAAAAAPAPQPATTSAPLHPAQTTSPSKPKSRTTIFRSSVVRSDDLQLQLRA